VKGKGVSFMEDDAKWHHGVPSAAELKQALRELDLAEVKLKEPA
jgi:transketolase